MGSDSAWSVVPLGELVENYDSVRVPVKAADRMPGPYPYYGASGVVDHVDDYLFDGEYLLMAEDGENLRTRKTPVAFLATGKFWVNNHAHILKANERADTRYLMYALSRADIGAYLTGSTQPKLTQQALHRIPVPAPPVHEQRRIVRTLGMLDDKIDLNGRMNRTLESLARAIFKSWFVDFDPVRKRTEGKTGAGSGLPPSLAALFPSRLVDSEFGDVPEGWQVRPLSDVLLEVNERVGDALVPEYSSTNEGLQPRSERFKKTLSASSAKNKLVRRGNLVFGLSRRVLNFGLMRDSVGSVSSAYKVFAVDEAAVLPDLMERLIRSAPAYYFNVVSASSREGQSVSSDALRELMFVQPIMPVQEAFYRFTAPLGGLGDVLEEETRVSTDLRDTLLPHMLDREPAWRLSP